MPTKPIPRPLAELPADKQPLDTPAFIDDIGPDAELPPHFTLANTRELFGLRPGEQLTDGIKRRKAGQGE